MKKIIAVMVLVLGITSCAKSQEHISGVASQGNETYAQYSAARENWQSQAITDYQITVQVFSSFLAPPCSSEFVLVVKQGEIIDVLETVTAETIRIQDDTEIQNPECIDYERYKISSTLDEIDLLLDEPEASQVVEIDFNQDYGYIESLHIHYENSEAAKDIVYSNFKIMIGSSD